MWNVYTSIINGTIRIKQIIFAFSSLLSYATVLEIIPYYAPHTNAYHAKIVLFFPH